MYEDDISGWIEGSSSGISNVVVRNLERFKCRPFLKATTTFVTADVSISVKSKYCNLSVVVFTIMMI